MTQTSNSNLLVAVTTFQTTVRGVEEWITAGQIAEAGSWPVKHFPASFAPLKVDYLANPKRGQQANAQASATVSPAAMLRRRGGARRTERRP